MSEDVQERRATDVAATAFMMGEIRSDVKHILNALPQLQKDIEGVEQRLTTVEKFNTRVLGAAAVVIPALTMVANYAVAKFGG